MFKRYLCFLCVFVTQHRNGNAEATTEPPDKIGENVTAQIHVYYNSTYLQNISGESKAEDNSTSTEKIPTVFQELFKKVESYFHEKKVMVNFTVQSAEK
ncbi:hypothetical protein MTO96_040210, partial [Rhipicephalus appendiculatus]